MRPKPHSSNKRSSPRVTLLREITGYRLGPRSGTLFRAQLVNISPDGAQFFSSQNMDKGDKIALELETLEGKKSLTFPGTIVWVRKNAAQYLGRYSYGVRFQEFSEEQKRFIAKHFPPEIPSDEDSRK